ncbi:hypothetical protein [Lentilactobacillus kosonis]|uniref:Morphogenesis protein n=1 Tax=Lentilactobacillus kosonis TaxID=2810561 RepID=A0A401FPF6_9LACO|nr:hypothetical protein [Lentilactobacillus kosonis]GAY74275.1 hypothetical protein NBRC111893_2421 [Lentilactobacillus kosonis]
MANKDFDMLTPGIKKLQELANSKVYIGVPYDDDHLTMIALVQEYGTTIKPKNGQFLAIPTENAKGKKPREIPDLFFMQSKSGAYLLARNNGEDDIEVLFILRHSVTIPKRPFIRFTYDQHIDEWTKLMRDWTFEVLMGRLTVDEALAKLGKQAVDDMKRTIKEFKNPRNAPLTVANKGFDDPLIDTGKMMNSITWHIERG